MTGLALARARADARPGDFGARFDLAVAQTNLGSSDEHGGDHTAAEQSYRQALSGIVCWRPAILPDMEWQRTVGVIADHLGSMMMERGDVKAALPWLQESDAASARLVAIAPENLGGSAISASRA